jgi:hypothetical protein
MRAKRPAAPLRSWDFRIAQLKARRISVVIILTNHLDIVRFA